MLRPLGLALAAVAVAVLFVLAAGCGGDEPETPSEPPAELLRTATENPAPSGEAEIDLALELQGTSLLAGTTTASLDGPFALEGSGLPLFELAADAEVAGFGLDGALISTGEDVFVDFFGELYRVGADRIAAAERSLGGGLGLDAAAWFERPRYGGIEDVAGTETQRIEGVVRAGAVASQLAATAAVLGAPPLLAELAADAGRGPAEAWVAFDDQTIRRIRVEFSFTVPAGLESAARGIRAGAVTLEAVISDVGAEVEVEPPAGGGIKPIEKLIAELRELAALGGL